MSQLKSWILSLFAAACLVVVVMCYTALLENYVSSRRAGFLVKVSHGDLTYLNHLESEDKQNNNSNINLRVTAYLASSNPLKPPLGSVICDNLPEHAECIWTDDAQNKFETDLVIFQYGQKVATRNWPNNTQKKVIYSMESSVHYPHQDDDVYDYSILYRMNSTAPIPYFDKNYFVDNEGNPHNSTNFTEAINGATFVARNCHTPSGRETLVKELQTLLRVDSLSSCLHNTDWPADATKAEALSKYKLYLAFENSIAIDYVTEKVYDGLRAGVVPVYLGAPNIKEFVPKHSVIDVNDFEGPENLAQYLQTVMHNETLWNSYQTWRYNEGPKPMMDKFAFRSVLEHCRLCEHILRVRGAVF